MVVYLDLRVSFGHGFFTRRRAYKAETHMHENKQHAPTHEGERYRVSMSECTPWVSRVGITTE